MPYLTPDTLPLTHRCKRLSIPDDPLIRAAVRGAIYDLTKAENWEQFGAVPPEAIAYRMLLMFNEFEDSGCMLGTITAHAFETLPDHLIPCDGGTYQRDDYPDLYNRLEAGNSPLIVDVDTFTTPDLRNRFIYGAAQSNELLADGGEETVQLTVAEMPSHSHTTQPHVHNYVGAVPLIDAVGVVPEPSAIPNPMVTDPATVIVNANGGDQAHENMPPYLILGYAMVAK